MQSRVMLTALELDIFTAVGSGATSDEVARRACTDSRATEMLLNALAATGVLIKDRDIFHNTPETERYFVDGSLDCARQGLLHLANQWHRWSTLTDCVRAGAPMPHQLARESSEEWTRDFIAAMHYNAQERAGQVVACVGAKGVERMLDAGGGSGAYSIAFAKANPRLHATVLDRAEVLPITQRYIAEAGLTARIDARAGDLRFDDLGAGFNLVLVSAVCHALSPLENRDLIGRCYGALAAGGRLVIRDFVLQSDKTRPIQAALFALNMLAATPSGSAYSIDEHVQWMRAAGFGRIRHIGPTRPTSVIIGVRE